MSSTHGPGPRKRPADTPPPERGNTTGNAYDNNNNNGGNSSNTTVQPRRKKARLFVREEPHRARASRRSSPEVESVPSSSQVISIDDDDDDDDIPYTHSRSQSPLFLPSSDIEEDHTHEGHSSVMKTTASTKRAGTSIEDVISIDDDDVADEELKEYYVISDEEDDNHEADQHGVKQKTVDEQLTENVNVNTSNFHSATCAVCFDSPESTFFLPCGHIYCEDCVFRALSSIKTSTDRGGPCALCRAYTPYEMVKGLKMKKKIKVLEGC